MAHEEQGRRLDSWKEIADYLSRDVRTVVRWEKDKGLPVRRLPGGKRQSVFAFTAEIDAWLQQQDEPTEGGTPEPGTSIDSGVSAGENRTGMQAGAQAPRWMIAGVGALLVLVFLGWYLFTRSNEPPDARHAAVPAREVHFDAPAGTLRFVRKEVETGIQVYAFTPADLNGDGIIDLAFSSRLGDVVGVMLGKGGGNFQPAQIHEQCLQPERVVLADFSRDGQIDMAASCTGRNNVTILLGKGDGSFPERTEIPIPGGPRFLDAGDLNDDGWTDLVVSSFSEPALYVLMNHAGRFTSTQLSRYEAAFSLAVADLNGDGHRDLIASVRMHGKFGWDFYWGNGDGTFRPSHALKWDAIAMMGSGMIHPVDLNGDGKMDLVFTLWNEGVLISRGLGGGEFSTPEMLPGKNVSGGLWTFSVCDLDLDGKLDVLVAGNREPTLTLHRGNGDGTFAPGIVAPAEAAIVPFPGVADFNNDGVPDILVNAYFEKRSALLIADWKQNPPR